MIGRFHALKSPMSHTLAWTVVPPTTESRSTSAVFAPVFAAASAAPIPAGPPPTTTTSSNRPIWTSARAAVAANAVNTRQNTRILPSETTPIFFSIDTPYGLFDQ